jgi:hypothetical protein
MTHALANVLRNVATILVLVAEHYDSQPAVTYVRPFHVETSNGTTTGEVHITYPKG